MAATIPLIGSQNQSVVRGQKKLVDIQSYRNVPQFIKMVELTKDVAPVTYLLNTAGQIKPVGDKTFFHLEDDRHPTTAKNSSGSVSSGTTTFDLASGEGKNIVRGQILENPATHEFLLITSVGGAAGDTVTAVRGHGGSTAATIAANAYLQIHAMSDLDGNTAPQGLSTEPKRKVNYLQITKKAIELTGREMEAEIYGPDELTRTKMAALQAMMTECEKALLLGQLDAGSTAGHRTTTGGLTYWLTSNLFDCSGAPLPEDTLNQWIQYVFRFNAMQTRLFVCGDNVLACLDKIARDRLEYTTNDNEFGVEVIYWKSSFGRLKLLRHPMLSNAFDPSGTYAGYAFAIDMENFKKASFRNRSMIYKANVQIGDQDGRKDYWLDDFGAWVANERQHGWMYNVGIPFA